jgi:hypothetical protein
MGSKPDTLRACHLELVGDTWVTVAAVVMTMVVTVVVPIVAEVAAAVISIKGFGVVWLSHWALALARGSRRAAASSPDRVSRRRQFLPI